MGWGRSPHPSRFAIHPPHQGEGKVEGPSLFPDGPPSATLTPMTVLDISRAAAPKVHVLPSLGGLTRAQLSTALAESNVVPPDKLKMRTNQVWRWVHQFGITDFE